MTFCLFLLLTLPESVSIHLKFSICDNWQYLLSVGSVGLCDGAGLTFSDRHVAEARSDVRMGAVWTLFSHVYLFSLLSSSVWDTARFSLKYCFKGPLNPKQPTNLLSVFFNNVLLLWV